ncbi:MAG: HopJ type III effector protein [Chitinophagaceae bacterium]|nr:HopJ type III effector protein [Chitinophagaceae bacterium]
MTKNVLSELAAGKMDFAALLAYIDEHYVHMPTAFKNGDQYNHSSENQGSARVLFYARLNNLGKEDTLRLFAEHYQNVLDDPGAANHQNIRQFMLKGWDGVEFEGQVLLPK